MDIQNRPLVMARFFENPKCKPWDLVKKKRFSCCHGLISEGHGQYCLSGKMKIIIPKLSNITTAYLIGGKYV